MPIGPDQIQFGDFQSEAYKVAIQAYLDRIPKHDLPSEGVLDTTILFLRSLFYQLPQDHEYRWEGDPTGGEEDENETGITINSDFSVKKEVVEKRPALLVSLQPRQFMALHQDQLKHFNIPEDIYVTSDLVQGSVSIHAISRNAHLCRRLADWVGLAMRILVRNLTFAGFHSIHPRMMWSGIQQAGELVRPSDTEFMRATVGFNYTWTWTMRSTPINPTRAAVARMNIIAYGRPGPALDGSGIPGGIVDPEDLDSFTQILEVIDED